MTIDKNECQVHAEIGTFGWFSVNNIVDFSGYESSCHQVVLRLLDFRVIF